jgi:hypothetical protein
VRVSKRATLVFDSARAGALVGTRGPGSHERSLLFAAGAHAVDVVVFPAAAGLHVLHGQVIDTAREHGVRGAQVRLGAGDPVETDPYGQFALSTLGGAEETVLRVVHEALELECTVPALEAADRRCR